MPHNRLSIEIVALLGAKLAALSLMYFLFFHAAAAPQAAAVTSHVLNSSPQP